MIEFYLIDRTLIFLVNIIGILLASWVFFVNKQDRLNQLFFLMTFFILLWINFSYIANSKIYNPHFLFKLSFGALSLFFVSVYFFLLHFPKKEKRYPILDKLILLIGIILFYCSVFTNSIIKDVKLERWGTDIIYGGGKNLFFGIIVALIFLITIFILRKYYKLPEREKLKIHYFLMGTLFFITFNLIFNIIFPITRRTTEYYYLGDYSAIFPLGFTAYAIIKQELFGIRVILTQALVGVIAIMLLAQAVTATDWLEFSWKFLIFLVFLYFGYLLIKSVILEIKRRQEIEKIDKAKSEFISIASHQLRTPLTAVKGYISMILEGTYGQLAEKQTKPLENVYQSNERLIRLVNDLLNLSRLDAGKIEFSPELTSLEEMVSDIIEELRINAEKKGLYIKMVKPPEPLPKIMVDQDKLRQVILNIFDNAIKYTKEGGVTFELKKLDGEEEIKVSDTGEGMDEGELNSLFQMFSRATAGTQLHAEGAGLGLYVAKQFIEMHGGKIWAESPGKSKGSTFYIQLPIHLDPKLLKTKTKTITKSPNDIF